MQFLFETSPRHFIKAIYLTARSILLKTIGLFQNKSIPFAGNIQSILFIRVDRLGDMVLSTPAFKAIKTQWPHVKMTVMASPTNAPVLKNNPDVDEVIVYDQSASLFQKMKFINALRSKRFDLAIDPYTDYELKTAWMARMSCAGHRIGYAAFGREVLFNYLGPRMRTNKHFVDGALDLLKCIGVSAANRAPAIYLGKDERARASQWLRENKLCDKEWVAVHPGAYYETQRWLPEHYAELIRLIQEQTPWDVVLLGGASDAMVINEILAKLNKPVCVSIQEDIRKFFTILSHCRLLVCNNSGPLHCAVALNIPSISFMGPTVKERWKPIGEHHHVLRNDDLPCIGCNLGTCKIETHDCMRLIKPTQVFKIVFEKMP